MLRSGISSTLVRIVSAISALILFAIPYQYCMDGMGYGFPFAWYHPGHDDWATYIIHPEEKFSDVIDFVNITASLVLWCAIYRTTVWFNNRKNCKEV